MPAWTREALPILAYARPQAPLFIALAVSTIFGAMVSTLQPWPMKLVLDSVLGKQPAPPVLTQLTGDFATEWLLPAAALGGLALFALQSGLDAFNSWGWTVAGRRAVYNLAEAVFVRLQMRSLLYHGRTGVGERVSLLGSDCWALHKIIDQGVFAPARSVFTLAFIAVVMWGMNPGLTVVALVAATCAVLASRLIGKRLGSLSERARQLDGAMRSHVHQVLTGLHVVQAFGQEKREHARFRQFTEKALRAQQKRAVVTGLNGLVTGLLVTLANAALIWFSAREVIDGRLTVGAALVFFAYLATLMAQVRTLSGVYPALKTLSPSTRRLSEILDASPEITDRSGAVALSGVRGEVVFEGAGFAYEPGRPALSGVSFRAAPGQTVALVGPTGAGKSSLVSLIPRFFDPTQGRVLLDGRDVRDIQLASLRSQVGLVLQEPFLFPISVAENIAYGRPSATRSEIEAAARAANADGFISRLPDGYDTVLGERGSTLSGGERQRLSIARALLKDAPILILDEPTSALDAETEAEILEAIQRLIQGRTTFIIAHRLATIRHADQILVLQDGRIVEQGTHQDLVETSGLYARYAALQLNNAGSSAA